MCGYPCQDHPVACVDEVSQAPHEEVRTPQPARPRKPAYQDHTYIRAGTANLFMITAPLTDWRQVEVTSRRSKLGAPVNWRFNTDHARIKLQSLYPTV